MGAVYRVRQFLAALRPRVRAGDRVGVVRVLSAEELALFQQMPVAYQRHGLNVLRRLEMAGRNDPDLLRAALLHDVAKGAAVGLSHRVLIVLLERFAPGTLAWLGRDGSARWRQPFYVNRNHAEIGARLARSAGAPERTIELISRHHDSPTPEDGEALHALRGADGSE